MVASGPPLKEQEDAQKAAKELALRNIRRPTLEVALRRWWVEKYRLPWTHELFQNAIPFDLMVEYYEDLFEEDPHAQLDSLRGDDGEIVIDDTGDPLFDKWERELAKGLEPDLEEGLADEEKEKLKQERVKSKNVRTQVKEVLVNDDFSKLAEDKDLEKYQSKFIAPGSPEDRALLRAHALGKAQDSRTREPGLLGGALNRRGR